MGSPVNYRVSSLTERNTDNSNESNDEFEEESINFNDHFLEHPFLNDDEGSSEISITNDMETDLMESDLYYEQREVDLISVDDEFLINDNSREINVNEEFNTTDSEGEVDENIEQASKKIKLDVKEKITCNEPESTDVADKCPICLESWNSSGKHRLCSLRCGHLFGYKCIKLWLNSDNNGAKNCPQCHAKASIRHIRFLYANKLTSTDNSEFERMKEELKQVRLRESKVQKALVKEKQKTKKYKQMYKARMLALTADSDFCLSD